MVRRQSPEDSRKGSPPREVSAPGKNCVWGIYVILDSKLAKKPHFEIAREAILGGARVIQLREKHLPRQEVLAIARDLRALTRDYGVTFIINDDADMAAEVDADGLHIGQEDMSPSVARGIIGPHRILGLSTHTLEQAKKAMEQPVDYIGVGPVFPTRTKENPWPTVGVELIRSVRSQTSHIITAIGGIREEHIPELVEAGAHNIAMIGEIMTAPDIRSKVARLCELYEAAVAEARSGASDR